MKILGISAFYHDSAAAIIEDGRIIAAAQEERFTRKKHDPSFPSNAVLYCLKECATTIEQLDAIVFYDKPFLKFERLLETYYSFAPKGIKSFMMAIPVWLKEKIFLKKLIFDELQKIDKFDRKNIKLLFPEHHLSHAASVFYPSNFKEAAILTIDGVGEWATASICHGVDNEISVLKELKFPHSLGLLYSAFTFFLGFKVNSGEYKLMGLAPYGRKDHEKIKEYEDIIKSKLIQIYDDGSIWLNQKYFNYSTGLTMVKSKEWENLFEMPKRKAEGELEQRHCDLGLAIQNVTEEIVIKMARHAKDITNCEYLCLAGGVALNCVANGKLQNEKIFKDIFIQPAAGDAGGALGAALIAYYIYYKNNRIITDDVDQLNGSYLGPSFLDRDIQFVAKKYSANYSLIKDDDYFYSLVADLLAKGSVVGWFQGRMEFGPRALGARSILGDPRNEEMQKKLNLKIKYRESFRPFAPSVLEEDALEFFEENVISPYMLEVQPIKKSRRKNLPDNYLSLPLRDKLYFLRSDIPAITHVDFTARIQTVSKKTNPDYWNIINTFKSKTGYGMLVNTSFNVRGEPIVCNPEDAYRCFMRTEMDYLVMGRFVFDKRQQPEWSSTDNWKTEYVLD